MNHRQTNLIRFGKNVWEQWTSVGEERPSGKISVDIQVWVKKDRQAKFQLTWGCWLVVAIAERLSHFLSLREHTVLVMHVLVARSYSNNTRPLDGPAYRDLRNWCHSTGGGEGQGRCAESLMITFRYYHHHLYSCDFPKFWGDFIANVKLFLRLTDLSEAVWSGCTMYSQTVSKFSVIMVKVTYN